MKNDKTDDSNPSPDFGSLFDNLLNGFNRERVEAYEKVKGEEFYQDARSCLESGQYETFTLLSLNQHLLPIEGLVSVIADSNPKAEFAILHYKFVESHFRQWFETLEGDACCADKSRTIVKSIISSLLTGTEITFDYDGEYTYHLPKKHFKTHEEIMEFFEGLINLYYGSPTKYLKNIAKLIGATS